MTISRRRFLAGAAVAPFAIAGATASGRFATPAREETLRLAVIGVGNRGRANLEAVRGERIVALCDVDSGYLAGAAAELPDARSFRDFRELIEAREALDLDGVVISTPDHTHAAATAAALVAGLPVYCEKPLTHTLDEAHAIARLARTARVPTQMGTQIHAVDNYRRVVELVRAGAIGDVTAVDCWVGKSWGDGRLTPGAVAPPTLDWTLWQGPVPAAPYVEGIHPANWRRYWSYGTGTLGDMGCHILDLPVWALELSGTGGLRAEVRAEGPPVDAVGAPGSMAVSWRLLRGAGRPPVTLRWFDGGRIPPFVQEVGAKDEADYYGRFNVCFQGTDGALFANYGEHLLWPSAVADGTTPPPRTIPSSPGHHAEWLQAIRAGTPDAPLCSFSYAARLTGIVLLGNVAYRAGRPIEFDFGEHRLNDSDGALQRLMSAPRREGWALPSGTGAP